MSDITSNEDFYQYADRAQTALLNMVRQVMREAAQDGLQGAHHFYLTFHTHADGVEMSDRLRANHPLEITIVLQNQYEDLQVHDDAFDVTLSFNNIPERLHVPFDALSKFYDPSVAFGLMFDVEEPDDADFDGAFDDTLDESAFTTDILAAQEDQASAPASQTGPQTGEVVSLDSFRDK